LQPRWADEQPPPSLKPGDRPRPAWPAARLSPGERAISREQAFVILERLDEVEGQLEHLRQGLRDLLMDGDSS
jgi:hypothetical protein